MRGKKKRSWRAERVLAAGWFNLPAVAVYWMNESCEAGMKRRAAGCTGRLTPEGWLLANGRLRFAL